MKRIKKVRPFKLLYNSYLSILFCSTIFKLQYRFPMIFFAGVRRYISEIVGLVSILPTFSKQLFLNECVLCSFSVLTVFVIFWQKEIFKKAARKMLVKLTPSQIFPIVFWSNKTANNQKKTVLYILI